MGASVGNADQLTRCLPIPLIEAQAEGIKG